MGSSGIITISDFEGMADAEIYYSLGESRREANYAESYQTTGVILDLAYPVFEELTGRVNPLLGAAYANTGETHDLNEFKDVSNG